MKYINKLKIEKSSYKEKLFMATAIIVAISLSLPISISSIASFLFSVQVLLYIKPKVRISLFYVLIISYFLLMCIPVLRGVNIFNFGIEKYLPFILFPYVFAQAKIEINKRTINIILFFLSLSSSLVFFVAIIKSLLIFNENEFYLFRNGYSPVIDLVDLHTTYFSMIILLSYSFLFNYLITNWKCISTLRKSIVIVWIVLQGIAILYIRSRVPILALILLNVFFSFAYFNKKYRFKVLLSYMVIIMTIVLLIEKTNFYKGRIGTEDISIALEEKKEQFGSGIAIFLANPVFGVGIDRIKDLQIQEYTKRNYISGIKNKFNAHNQIISTLSILGIVGASILIFLTLSLLKYELNYKTIITSSFLMIIVITNLTESTLLRHKGIVFYVFFSCLFYKYLKFLEKKSNGKENRFS
ncbi:O-antigen ligase family protein [Aquimarina algiphila]|uniref:O-antigen ligase family protein n=1 Tax=Aquimarina algiphila TaxID=2047982 RepID=UPI00232CCB2A|nr:O-antigen ligase family protein [Aquimarina algiphila]